jgi:hypothetical protein
VSLAGSWHYQRSPGARTLGWLNGGTTADVEPLAGRLPTVHGRVNFGADQVGGGPDRVHGKVRVACRCYGLTMAKELADHWKAHAKAVAQIVNPDIVQIRPGAYAAPRLLQQTERFSRLLRRPWATSYSRMQGRDRDARCFGWIEGQLGKEPLAGSIARCNLPQLRNVCGTQWRVIIDPVEMCGDIRI